MKLLVRVTAEDIAEGRPRSGEYCPVALAFKRALAKEHILLKGVTISYLKASYSAELDRCGYRIWESAQINPRMRQWIKDFDKGLDVKPTHTTFVVSD